MSESRQHVSIGAQISATHKAFEQRESAILRDVQRGKMKEAVGELEVAYLRAAMGTLLWLQRHEAAIKAKVEGAKS